MALTAASTERDVWREMRRLGRRGRMGRRIRSTPDGERLPGLAGSTLES
jgi:hypothetical protein